MAKIILGLGGVFFLLLLIRGATGRRQPPPSANGARPVPKPRPMLACAQCGMHLPGDDVLPGRGGVFCSEEHRAAYERTHGAA